MAAFNVRRWVTSHEWHYDRVDKDYSMTILETYCRVWRTPEGQWGGIATEGGKSSAAYHFRTPDEAKTWCVDQVVKWVEEWEARTSAGLDAPQ